MVAEADVLRRTVEKRGAGTRGWLPGSTFRANVFLRARPFRAPLKRKPIGRVSYDSSEPVEGTFVLLVLGSVAAGFLLRGKTDAPAIMPAQLKRKAVMPLGATSPAGLRMRISMAVFLVMGLAAAPASAQRMCAVGAEPEEVYFRNGDISLAGLWFVPAGEGPFPGAVFIRGSGPSNRRSYWAHAVLDVLLEDCVAVLLPDKRGSDGSGGDWRTADFDDLAADALAAVDYVRARPEVRQNAVGLVGLSQGGKIAPVAAARSDDVAFVIDLAGAATTFVEQVSWEMYHTFREAGLEGQSLQDALHLQVAAERYVEGQLEWEQYEEVLRDALATPWAEVAEGFSSSPESWRWGFFQGVIDFDPLTYWREVQQPVLVVYGEDDHNAPAARSVYRLTRAFVEEEHRDWTIRIIPGTGHGLWNRESPDHHHPELHPSVVALLTAWISRVTR